MARVEPPLADGGHPQPGTTGGHDPDRLRLLRNSHIFASAIQDVFQVDFLHRVSPHSITPSQLQLLRLMSRNGEHMLSEVAEFLGVTPPAASKHVDRLEAFGLVRRQRSLADRRVTLLSASEEGRRVVERYDALAREHLGVVLSGFEPREIEGLSSLLERFAVSLLEESPDSDGACLRCAAYLADECPIGEIRGGCPHAAAPAYTSPGGAEDYG